MHPRVRRGGGAACCVLRSLRACQPPLHTWAMPRCPHLRECRPPLHACAMPCSPHLRECQPPLHACAMPRCPHLRECRPGCQQDVHHPASALSHHHGGTAWRGGAGAGARTRMARSRGKGRSRLANRRGMVRGEYKGDEAW